MKKELPGIHLLLLFSFLLSITIAYSQTKKEKKILKEAEKNYALRKYQLALSSYLKLYKMDSVNFKNHYELGICYLNSPAQKIKSIPFLQHALQNTDTLPTMYYYLGQAYHLANRFDDAIAAYQKFKQRLRANSFGRQLQQEVDRRIEQCNYGKILLTKPVKVVIHNLGDKINSLYPDYSPVVSADESILIFTSRRKGSTGDLLDENGEYFEDIYITKNENWQWIAPARIDSGEHATTTSANTPSFLKAKKISSKLNTESHDAAIGLSPDGQKLFLYRDEGVFESTLNGTTWGAPVKLNSNINYKKGYQPSISIAADGKTVYFVSDRKGGFGGRDIYKAEKLANGDWGPAVNLGATINTSYDEDSPFIHADGKTLYFSSQGHAGMGGYDIFKSINMNGVWSNPENMGYPINTAGDDIYYVVTAKGNHAYFSSVRDSSVGGMDIYLLLFPGVSIPVTEVAGLVLGGDSLKPMVACIKVIDKESGKEVMNCTSNAATGKYTLVLPPNKKYAVEVSVDGYKKHTEDIFIPDQKEYYTLYQEIHFVPVQTASGQTIGQEVSMQNAFFDIEKSVLSDTKLSNDLVKATETDTVAKKKEEIFSQYLTQIDTFSVKTQTVDTQNTLSAQYCPAYQKINKMDYFTSSDSIAKMLNVSPSVAASVMNATPAEVAKIVKLPSASIETISKLPTEVKASILSLPADSLLTKPSDSLVAMLTKTKKETMITTEVSGPLVELKGLITRENTRPLQATISLVESASNKPAGTYLSDKKTGKYTAMVEPGKQYQFIIKSSAFRTDTQQVVFPSNTASYKLFQEFNLDAIRKSNKQSVGQTLNMTMTFFTAGKANEESAEAIYSAPDKKEKEQQIKKLSAAFPQQLKNTKKLLNEMALYYKKDKIKYYETNAVAAKKIIGKDTIFAKIGVNKENKQEPIIVASNKQKMENGKQKKVPPTTVIPLNLDSLSKIIEVVKPVYAFAKADLHPKIKQELDLVVTIMLQYKTIRVEISGHTDSIGTDKYNQRLSEARAKTAANYLREKGIEKGRITTIGFGKKHPITTNNTPEGRQTNRRVEIKIKN